MHPFQKLHVKAANDNEIDKEDFAWRILKIQLVKKKLSGLSQGIIHKPFKDHVLLSAFFNDCV